MRQDGFLESGTLGMLKRRHGRTAAGLELWACSLVACYASCQLGHLDLLPSWLGLEPGRCCKHHPGLLYC
jgi:hypothetical protein